jgi:hypothetical protein
MIRQRMRGFILSIRGTDTRIDTHLTHKLRVRYDISLKYIVIISHQLQYRVRWDVRWSVIDSDVNILRIREKKCAIKKIYLFYLKKSSKFKLAKIYIS